MDFNTLFLSFVVGKSAVFLSILIYVCIKKKKFIFSLSLENILLLSENFDVPENDQYTTTITCKEEVINISEKIIDFLFRAWNRQTAKLLHRPSNRRNEHNYNLTRASITAKITELI